MRTLRGQRQSSWRVSLYGERKNKLDTKVVFRVGQFNNRRRIKNYSKEASSDGINLNSTGSSVFTKIYPKKTFDPISFSKLTELFEMHAGHCG